MIRVLNTAEKNLVADAPIVYAIPAGGTVTTQVLPNESRSRDPEIAYRYIQNVGNSPCLYFIGTKVTGSGNPSLSSYHGVLAIGAQLDCSNHAIDINVYSTAATTIATTIIRRITSQSQSTFSV